MKIKVCGMRDARNIAEVTRLAPDYMGFIYYAPSPRFAGDTSGETFSAVPASIRKTLVLVNEDTETAKALLAQHHFDAVQLHGAESPAYAAGLKGKAEVWKAFGINEAFNFGQLEAYKGVVDYFLFDTKTEVHGGSGRSFNWRLLDKYKLDIPFFLSGGLSLENLKSVTEIKHPQFYGVDLNSRFELSPGLKDVEKLQQAFTILKPTDEIRS